MASILRKPSKGGQIQNAYSVHPQGRPPESALDSPAFAVQTLEVVGGRLGAAGGQAPSLLHVLVTHAQRGADLITVSRHLGAAQHLRASTGSDPGGGGARLAVARGDGDVAAEADDVIKFQLLAQHTVE